MQLFRPKKLDLGFVLLCPDSNPGTLRITATGIRSRYPGAPVITATPENTHPDDFAAISAACPAYRGLDTITSLINVGLNNSSSEWSMVVISGSHVRRNLDLKFSLFINDRRDILFPLVDGRTNFVDGTINGIMIHRETWREVGNFCNQNPLGICKLMWVLDAMKKGCTFKAIIGAQIL